MDSAVEAQVKFVFFLGEHYLAFLLADHCLKLFPSLFPDSTIGRTFKCGCTKATAIFKVVDDEVMKELCGHLQQSQFFSLPCHYRCSVVCHCALLL